MTDKTDNIENFYPQEEAMMIMPTRLFLGFNKEEGLLSITFCGDEPGSKVGYVISLEDAKFLETELKRVRRLAGGCDE